MGIQQILHQNILNPYIIVTGHPDILIEDPHVILPSKGLDPDVNIFII